MSADRDYDYDRLRRIRIRHTFFRRTGGEPGWKIERIFRKSHIAFDPTVIRIS